MRHAAFKFGATAPAAASGRRTQARRGSVGFDVKPPISLIRPPREPGGAARGIHFCLNMKRADTVD
jgi:hypothetical protein